MIWIIKGNESHEIISTNIHVEDDKFQLWVTRPNGKTIKIFEDKDKNEANLLKDAIDYAITTGEKSFTIK